VKNLIKYVCLICLSLCFSGCYPFGPDASVLTYYDLNGQREIKQSDHVAILGAPGFTDEPVKYFDFLVRGKKNYPLKLESVQGSYKFYSENPQPFEVKSLTNNQATLFLATNVIRKLPYNSHNQGEIKRGRYKIDIAYRLNGQDYQCHFDIDYETRHKTIVYVPGVTHIKTWN